MTQYEMTERLSEKMNITLEEAKAALESSDWNLLTATHQLEQERFRRMQELNEVASACAAQAAPEAEAAEGETAGDAGATAEAIGEDAPASGAGRRGRGLKNLGSHLRRLLACGNRNRFAIERGGEQLLEMPVTVLALLLLFSFGTCALLLVIGLFAGCHYSVSGDGRVLRV